MAASEAIAETSEPVERARALLRDYGLAKADEVRQLLQDAQDRARGRGDKDAEVDAIRVLIDMHLAKKEFDDALRLANQAVGILEDKGKKAKTLCLVAEIQLAKGEGTREAMSILGKAQVLYKEAGNRSGEVEAMGMIAQMHFEDGDVEQALRVAREAVSISPDASTAMHTIAQVHMAKGDPAQAVDSATEMLTVCRDKGNKAGQAAASLMLANAVLSMNEVSLEGLQCGRDALALFQEVGDVYGTASALHTLANGYFARGDLEEGLKCAREALACFRQTGDRGNEELLKQTIDQARAVTQEYRKQVPKRPFVPPPSAAAAPQPTGPEQSAAAEGQVPKELLDVAVAGRKYWGVPTQVQPDPTVDAAERAPSHTVIWGMNLSDNSAMQVCVEFGDLIVCMAKGDIAKIPITVLTCGVYGRQVGEHQLASMTNAAAATIWGMVRTARQEIPAVMVQLLDFSESMTAAEIPRSIRPMLPESAYYHKARWEPQIAAVPSLFRRDLRRDNLTGGGGGGGTEDAKRHAKFLRKSFSWTGPSHKLDFCWYRQEWRAVGPAFGDVGPMPPPPPCRAMRTC